MLKLLVFAPCEKIIISEERTSSLVTILEAVNIGMSAEEAASISEDTATVFVWDVYTLWHRESDEDLGNYEQRIQLTTPDGRTRLDQILSFKVAEEFRNYRNRFTVRGFPVSPVGGECTLKLGIRKTDGPNEWQEVAEYPVLIRFVGTNAPQEKETT